MAVSLDTTGGRTVIASAGQLWAYFAAMSVNDWGVASSVLNFFQRNWVTVRPAALDAVRSGFPAATMATIESTLPQSITPSGMWDDATHFAARIVLLGVFGSETYRAAISSGLPHTAAGVGAWFTSFEATYASTLPADVLATLDSFEDETQDGAATAAANIEGRTLEVVSGITIGTPIVTSGTASTRDVVGRTGSASAVEDASASARTSSGASVLTASHDPAAPRVLDPVNIFGRRATGSTWAYVAIALGVLAFGGLSYWAWLYRQRRRSTA